MREEPVSHQTGICRGALHRVKRDGRRRHQGYLRPRDHHVFGFLRWRIKVSVRGQVLVDLVTAAETKGVAASEERRGSAVCVPELRVRPFIGGLSPKVHGITVLKPIFPCTNDAGHLAPRFCHGDGLWVVPMEREGTRHRERQVEGGRPALSTYRKQLCVTMCFVVFVLFRRIQNSSTASLAILAPHASGAPGGKVAILAHVMYQ